MMKQIRWIALLTCIVGCEAKPQGNATPSSPSPPSAASVATPVDLQLLDYEGIQQLIASKKGKVVVVDAWSTSCPPCMKEFPKLVALHKKHKPEDLACISLSFDYEGIGSPEKTKPKVLEFLSSQGATFDNVLSSDESDALYRKLELASVPAVFVYGRDGKLVKRFDNENAASEAEGFTYEQVGELVEQLLK
jgi:thiol-disulfide isomerase/thioredoxin